MFAEIFQSFGNCRDIDNLPEYLTMSCEWRRKFLNSGVEPVFPAKQDATD
jgi:hypothetical protein